MKNFSLSLILLFFGQITQAQITVSSISINGNIKTQKDIILREISFEENIKYTQEELSQKT